MLLKYLENSSLARVGPKIDDVVQHEMQGRKVGISIEVNSIDSQVLGRGRMDEVGEEGGAIIDKRQTDVYW